MKRVFKVDEVVILRKVYQPSVDLFFSSQKEKKPNLRCHRKVRELLRTQNLLSTGKFLQISPCHEDLCMPSLFKYSLLYFSSNEDKASLLLIFHLVPRSWDS